MWFFFQKELTSLEELPARIGATTFIKKWQKLC